LSPRREIFSPLIEWASPRNEEEKEEEDMAGMGGVGMGGLPWYASTGGGGFFLAEE
jgi:hypothetical protein